MSEAMFTVTFAGHLVTLQDIGRRGHMRYGVAASGPMDPLAFEAAHMALGNKGQHSAIEVSLGGVILTCTAGAIAVSITGGDFTVEHAGRTVRSWTVLTVQKGDRLVIRGGASGSWAYVAFAGELMTHTWLGSAATHSPSGFGGGTLCSGQQLRLREAALRDDRLGDIQPPDAAATGPLRCVIGPQDQHFTPEAIDRFLAAPFTVSQAYDRMGMRLEGPRLALNDALSIPSEPIVRGSVQVSGDGVPTVLMADHQTTGGYPKIATVISPDLPRLAQHRAGDAVRFSAISSDEAIAVARRYATGKAAYLAQVATPRGTLEERLMRENLNHGWAAEQPLP